MRSACGWLGGAAKSVSGAQPDSGGAASSRHSSARLPGDLTCRLSPLPQLVQRVPIAHSAVGNDPPALFGAHVRREPDNGRIVAASAQQRLLGVAVDAHWEEGWEWRRVSGGSGCE